VSNLIIETAREGITLITLNRPERLNAESHGLVHELMAALDAIAADRAVRAVVITGAGRGFCAGHDLVEIPGGDGDATGGRSAGLSVQDMMAGQRLFADLTVRVRNLPQPVIAAVNGPAAGGGLALALAADTRVCSTSARFNAAFVRIGLSGCDVGVSYLLPRIVGPTLAFEMMLTGRLVDAEEALRTGLVLRVVPDGEVVDAALSIAEAVAANSPFGVEMTKQVMWANLDAPSLEAAIELENRTQILCIHTEDQREAIVAFVEKRPPRFADR
jgi:enoyl-CoA hydratase